MSFSWGISNISLAALRVILVGNFLHKRWSQNLLLKLKPLHKNDIFLPKYLLKVESNPPQTYHLLCKSHAFLSAVTRQPIGVGSRRKMLSGRWTWRMGSSWRPPSWSWGPACMWCSRRGTSAPSGWAQGPGQICSSAANQEALRTRLSPAVVGRLGVLRKPGPTHCFTSKTGDFEKKTTMNCATCAHALVMRFDILLLSKSTHGQA